MLFDGKKSKIIQVDKEECRQVYGNLKRKKVVIEYFLLASTSIGSVAIIVFAMAFAAALQESQGVDKQDLFQNIERAIQNGAGLDDVRQIFHNRKHVPEFNIFRLFRTGKLRREHIYVEPITLGVVLKDVKSEIFLKKDVNKDFHEKISRMLSEHERINPFDKLNSDQKLQFEQIQSKLGENYDDIEKNINLIVDELASKNDIVAKYLRDATLSFRISVVALIIGVLAFLPQFVGFWRWLMSKWRSSSDEEAGQT